MRKVFTNLTFWVLVMITAGILLGHFAPEIALQKILNQPWKQKFMGQELTIGATLSEFLSGIFISLVKLFINPIIFLTITLGIVNMGNLKKVGRVGAKAILYFEVVTTFALLIGVGVALVIQPGSGVDTTAVKTGDISKYTGTHNFNAWQFFKDNTTLQVLLAAILCGIGLGYSRYQQRITNTLHNISVYLFRGLHLVMLLAPIGAFGGMAFTIGKYGIATLVPLAKLMGSVYATMAVFIFGALGLIMRHYKISIWSFLKFIRQELLVVLGTSSSEAALPRLMEKLEVMGFQTGGGIGGTHRLFLQSGWHNDLLVDGHDLSGAGFPYSSESGADPHHHRHPDADLQRRGGRDRQRIHRTGLYPDHHQSDPDRRTRITGGCGPLPIRSQGHHEFHWQWCSYCLDREQ